eukprot:scaffold270258_cov67-Attheya_sp.AAC.3
MIRRCRISGEGGRPAGDSTSSAPITTPMSMPCQAPATATVTVTPNRQTSTPETCHPSPPIAQATNTFTVADGTAHKPKAMKMTDASGGGGAIVTMRHSQNMVLTPVVIGIVCDGSRRQGCSKFGKK